MAYRVIDLYLHSASNLKDVNVLSRMEVYAVASVDGDRKRQRTETDRHGTTHPKWEQGRPFRFEVPPAAAAFESDAWLRVLLRTERLFSFGGRRDVGEVVIPLADLLAGACDSGAPTAWQWLSLPVKKVRCSEDRGTLKISYRFGPMVPPFIPGIGFPPWQSCPPSFPRMGAGLLGGSFGGMRFGDMPSSDRLAYDVGGHGTAAANAGAVAV